MSEAMSADAASEAQDPGVAPAPVRRRKPTLDQKLAGAKEFALTALKELVAEEEIGGGHRVAADDERLVTHYFTSLRPGYRDWEWYVTLARVPRQGTPTICESGILPAEGALLAPEWVPWSERLNDDEKDQGDQEPAGEDPEGPDTDGTGPEEQTVQPAADSEPVAAAETSGEDPAGAAHSLQPENPDASA